MEEWLVLPLPTSAQNRQPKREVVILLPKVIYGLKAVAFRSLFYVLYKSVSGTAGQVILEEILAETHF